MKEYEIRVRWSGMDYLIGYVYHLGPGQWFMATLHNRWEGPRYARRICNY